MPYSAPRYIDTCIDATCTSCLCALSVENLITTDSRAPQRRFCPPASGMLSTPPILAPVLSAKRLPFAACLPIRAQSLHASPRAVERNLRHPEASEHQPEERLLEPSRDQTVPPARFAATGEQKRREAVVRLSCCPNVPGLSVPRAKAHNAEVPAIRPTRRYRSVRSMAGSSEDRNAAQQCWLMKAEPGETSTSTLCWKRYRRSALTTCLAAMPADTRMVKGEQRTRMSGPVRRTLMRRLRDRQGRGLLRGPL